MIKDELGNETICNFGILGTFPLSSVNFETNTEYSNSQIDNIIKEIVNQYNNDIDNNNKKVFTKIFNNSLWGVDGINIWNESYFNDIVNVDKLPANFNELDDIGKTNVLFAEEIDENDFNDLENSRLRFFKLDKIKEYCRIYNVTINEEYKYLSIELNFLYNNQGTAICYPMIKMDYSNNFEITSFDAGL